MSASPYIRRATTAVLVAVALLGGAILLLGDRFDAAPGYALTHPVRLEARMAACVAEESMRFINSDLERCRPDELELASQQTAPGASGPGPVGRAGADGVSGFEIVSAKLAVTSRQLAAGQVGCPAGKVAVGGGVLPDPESPRKGDAPDDRAEVVSSGPLLPSGDTGGYGWTATVKSTSMAPISVVVAAICVLLR
jgi:hypothetical protein